MQFHWNDYSDHNYILALQLLKKQQEEGLITALGLCNFDTIRMDEICTTLGPNSIVSNQVQVSSYSASRFPLQLEQSHDTCLMTACFLILYVIYAPFFSPSIHRVGRVLILSVLRHLVLAH